MSAMAQELGRDESAETYGKKFKKIRESVIEKLYDPASGYFRATVGDDRGDTVASIFGALYFLAPSECVKLEETFARRMLKNSGLLNFDPPYPFADIFHLHQIWGRVARTVSFATRKKTLGMDSYHNSFVWPWVTLQNIHVKVKIAREHPDVAVREKYQSEAVRDLLHMSEILLRAGGAYEILDADEPKPPRIFGYTPPRNFMGTLAGFQGAYRRLKELGWI